MGYGWTYLKTGVWATLRRVEGWGSGVVVVVSPLCQGCTSQRVFQAMYPSNHELDMTFLKSMCLNCSQKMSQVPLWSSQEVGRVRNGPVS